MKATDIMEALTDMDDDILMRAEIDPPRRNILLLRSLRSAAAACLALALFLTTLIVTKTFADEMGLRWRVRYRENEVTWLFKDGIKQEGELTNYEPTWLPEGYEQTSDYSGPTRDRGIGYHNYDEGRIWFHYMQITDQETYHLGSLIKGTYEVEAVQINGFPGEMYLSLEDPDEGKLIWIDKRNCIVFLLDFDIGAENAVKIAESVSLMEE